MQPQAPVPTGNTMLRCAGQAPQHLRSMIAEGGSMRFVQSGNQKELLWAWSHCSSASPGTTRLFFLWFHVVSWDKLRWVCYFHRYFGRVSTRKKRMRCCWETCHSTPFGAEKQAWTYTWWGCYGSEIKSFKPWEWVFATRSRSKIKMHQCNKAVFQPECQEEIAEKIDLQANPRTIFSTSGVFRFSLPF